MLTMIFTILINNTFELLILRHYFISNHLKSELKPDFTQHQRASKNIDLTGLNTELTAKCSLQTAVTPS